MLKKLLKIIAIVAGSLLVVFIAAVVALSLFFDPNDYKDEIAAYVKRETGRELVIDGNLSMSYFPWLGVRIEKTRISNAAGFDKKPFARVDVVDLKIKIMPLFSRKVVMDHITLNGLYLNLRRNRDGRSNWDDFVKREKAAAGKPPQPAEKGDDRSPMNFDISGIKVTNAHVIWDDRQKGKYLEISKLNLKSGHLGSGKPVDVSLDALVKEGRKQQARKVSLSGEVAYDSDDKTVDIKGLEFLFGGKQPIDLAADMFMDMGKGTMNMSRLRLKIAGLDIRGSVKGRNMNTKPSYSGSVSVADFVPLDVMKAFGIKPPVTADKSVLGKASMRTGFTYSANGVDLYNLKLSLDDSVIEGKFSLVGFSNPAYRVNLSINEIDVDRYLPPRPKGGKAAKQPAASGAAPAGLFPVKLLRSLDARGELKIGKLKVSGIESQQAYVKLLARRGDIHLFPLSASLYDGKYKGDIRVNVQGSTPRVSMHERLYNIQAQPFLKSAAGWDAISGSANMTAKLSARGNSITALQRTLSGTVSMDASDGSIKGIDIGYQIAKALAVYNKQPVPPQPDPTTLFNSLVFRANVTNGVVNNHTMALNSPLLKVTGKGTVNLPARSIDYRTSATLLKSPVKTPVKHLDKIIGQPIYVTVKGPFSKLSYGVDIGAILKKQLEQKAKDKLRKKLEKKFKLKF